MTTKEAIKAEIDKMGEEALDELYELIRDFARSRVSSEKPTLMDSLLEIQIEGPEDFAANLDLYLSGEKREEEKRDEPNIH